ncbi:hypothetical protein [Sunxiuqinia elliptica]|uniref:Uncharacterized protein n=1 Tax=Sunxiuqinia elliptica TaxID=655355 RepID=A0A4V6PRX3_9BACT|nr:hypothetical protein [Sunxiuqinia elliptica]TDO05429.1 hypothetical protein DET52_101789 [Sunxiuqinia elliptica]TDO64975.1 hypothetical protein DET65_1348 [Sunxiuqinia elliptica]
MKLFSDKQRTDQDYAKSGERTYSFLNRSGREEFAAVREKLNKWFSSYPEQEQNELKKRFVSRAHFDDAFFELYMHEFFYSRGYQLAVHPLLANTRKQPDFLVSKNAQPFFYLEAKVVRDVSDEEKAYEEKRKKIIRELDKLGNFPYWISVQRLELKNSGSFSVKPIIAAIQKKSALFDYIQMLKKSEREHLCFENENLSIELSFYPRSNSNLEGLNRAVGAQGYYDAKYVNTHVAILKAIEEKAKRYGKPDLPLVIAVNCISPNHFSIDDLELVLGKDFYRLKSNKSIHGDRIIHTDGIFRNSAMKHVTGLFSTWVTPYHQGDEQWFWCENPGQGELQNDFLSCKNSYQ